MLAAPGASQPLHAAQLTFSNRALTLRGPRARPLSACLTRCPSRRLLPRRPLLLCQDAWTAALVCSAAWVAAAEGLFKLAAGQCRSAARLIVGAMVGKHPRSGCVSTSRGDGMPNSLSGRQPCQHPAVQEISGDLWTPKQPPWTSVARNDGSGHFLNEDQHRDSSAGQWSVGRWRWRRRGGGRRLAQHCTRGSPLCPCLHVQQ